MPNRKAPYKAYYKYEIAYLYEISVKTLIAKLTIFEDELKELDYHRNQKIFTVNQTKLIFRKLGRPHLNGRSIIPKKR